MNLREESISKTRKCKCEVHLFDHWRCEWSFCLCSLKDSEFETLWLRKEIEKIVNYSYDKKNDYLDVGGARDKLHSLFKQWAKEMVGEDSIHNSDVVEMLLRENHGNIQTEGIYHIVREAKQEIRERIEEA